jgi:hypothetical protein
VATSRASGTEVMMNIRTDGRAWAAAAVLMVAIVLSAIPARAHCDGLDGPVVTAARRALEQGDVTATLAWVRPQDEAEIRAAFQRTLEVRRQGKEARELADLYFFETLVRVHRAGEGVAYTGLKPAGRDLGPAIPAADRAMTTGDVEPIVEMIVHAARQGIRHRFAEAMRTRPHGAGDVAAARSHVEAYVAFIHYVESLYLATTHAPTGHAPEAGATVHEDTHGATVK